MTATPTQPNPRDLVLTPADCGTAFVQYAEAMAKDPGIPLNIPGSENQIVPLRPGNMAVFIARPGHGKTSLMTRLAKLEAARIQARNAAEREAVVYVTWEEIAEELEAMFQAGSEYSLSDFAWGRVDLEVIRRQAIRRAGLPIWVIGISAWQSRKRLPRMYPETVLSAIESMEEDFGVKPTLLLFDYVQLIPIREAHERTEQVTEAAARIKELAQHIGAAAVVGAQSRQEVDDRAVKIPGMRDAQWASGIGQVADKVFGLWRPALTEEAGSFIKLEDGRTLPVTPTLLLIRMVKQRMAAGRATWALHFDPDLLRLTELEMIHVEL